MTASAVNVLLLIRCFFYWTLYLLLSCSFFLQRLGYIWEYSSSDQLKKYGGKYTNDFYETLPASLNRQCFGVSDLRQTKAFSNVRYVVNRVTAVDTGACAAARQGCLKAFAVFLETHTLPTLASTFMRWLLGL